MRSIDVRGEGQPAIGLTVAQDAHDIYTAETEAEAVTAYVAAVLAAVLQGSVKIGLSWLYLIHGATHDRACTAFHVFHECMTKLGSCLCYSTKIFAFNCMCFTVHDCCCFSIKYTCAV